MTHFYFFVTHFYCALFVHGIERLCPPGTFAEHSVNPSTMARDDATLYGAKHMYECMMGASFSLFNIDQREKKSSKKD